VKRIRTIEVASHPGERVCIAGWLHALRQMGGINFLVIRDGWGTVQSVAETETELSSLLEHEGGLESVLSVEGLVVNMPHAPVTGAPNIRLTTTFPRDLTRLTP